jgi:hypothetical protein
MGRQKPQYPPTWREVSRFIRFERAQGQCECTGKDLCGLHCTHPGPRRCVERDRQPAQWANGRIILTVAHVCDCWPLCAEPAHLAAFCQRCHLRTDMRLHAQHAAETRRLAKEALGQVPMPWLVRG